MSDDSARRVAQGNAFLAMAMTSPRLDQLSLSHPLLYFALATGYGNPLDSERAIALCEKGRPLREVAAALGIPYGLRRIPYEIAARPLTRARLSEDAARIIAQRCARFSQRTEAITRAAFYGTRIGGEEFGMWLSRPEFVDDVTASDLERFRGLALFAWVSTRPDQPLSALAPKPWSPHMSFRGAIQDAKTWLSLVKYFIYFANQPIADPWGMPMRIDGYDIVPLTTFEQLVDEILDMENCLIGYADNLVRGMCRLFGVRESSTKIGTAEVIIDAEGMPVVIQFCGPKNSSVPLRARAALDAWAARQAPAIRANQDLSAMRQMIEAGTIAILTPWLRAGRIEPGFWRYRPTLEMLDRELRSISVRSSSLADAASYGILRNRPIRCGGH